MLGLGFGLTLISIWKGEQAAVVAYGWEYYEMPPWDRRARSRPHALHPCPPRITRYGLGTDVLDPSSDPNPESPRLVLNITISHLQVAITHFPHIFEGVGARKPQLHGLGFATGSLGLTSWTAAVVFICVF